MSKFKLGITVCTPAAQDLLGAHSVSMVSLLDRHSACDWGDVGIDDALANDAALKDGSQILSVYKVGAKDKVLVITEWDRSITTVLLPSDY
jgi:hypothetical protein